MPDDDQPDQPDDEATTPAVSTEIVETRLKSAVDGVLPETIRTSLRDLSNPTGVNMLVSLLQESKDQLAERESELVHLRQEHSVLRDVCATQKTTIAERQARHEEQGVSRLGGTFLMIVGGVAAGAFGWTGPLEWRLVVGIFGLLAIVVGLFMNRNRRSEKR